MNVHLAVDPPAQKITHGMRPLRYGASLGGFLLTFTAPPTRNPVKIIYGRVIKFPNVPKSQVTLQSERIPVTGAQTQFLIKWLMGSSAEITVSSLELTFDVCVRSMRRVLGQVIHRAKREHLLRDCRGWETLYIGSPTSPWQVRIHRRKVHAAQQILVAKVGAQVVKGIDFQQYRPLGALAVSGFQPMLGGPARCLSAPTVLAGPALPAQ
jgi:hypothetical protein